MPCAVSACDYGDGDGNAPGVTEQAHSTVFTPRECLAAVETVFFFKNRPGAYNGLLRCVPLPSARTMRCTRGFSSVEMGTVTRSSLSKG